MSTTLSQDENAAGNAPERAKEEQGKKPSLRERFRPRKITINSPWILLAVPLLLVGMWLINNPWIITNNIAAWDHPFILLVPVVAVACVAAVWVLFNFYKAIVAGCKHAGRITTKYLAQPGSKYWIALSIFLTVSVLEAGTFFNELLGPSSLHDTLGYAVAVAIDSVTVICILARQGAVRKSDRFGQGLYMLGIIVCAGISTLANAYITQEHYVAPHNVASTIWAVIAPIVGVAPPLLVVFLGFASDYTTDQASSKLDPDAFEASEKNRIRFYEIQFNTLTVRKKIQQEIALLAGKTAKVKQLRPPRQPLISINTKKPEPLDIEQLVEKMAPMIAQKVAPKPQDYIQLRATLVDELKQLIPAPEPLDIEQLAEKVAPMIAEQMVPEPLDYEQLAQVIVPHLAPQMRTVRATLIEEVRAIVPQIVAAKKPVTPQIEASKKAAKSTLPEQAETTLEARLEVALQEMVVQGKKPSGRALSEVVRCNRGTATAWLRATHPEYGEPKMSGTESQSSESFDSGQSVASVPVVSGTESQSSVPLDGGLRATQNTDVLETIVVDSEPLRATVRS